MLGPQLPPSSYWTVPAAPCLSSTPSSYWTLGWHRPRLGRFIGLSPSVRAQTVQILDAFSAWLAPSKTWTLYRTVPSVCGSHCPVLDTRPNRPNSGRFFQRGSHRSLCSQCHRPVIGQFLGAAPQLSVAHTVQNLDAWLVLHGLVSRLHLPRLGYFVGGLHCPGPVHLLGWSSHCTAKVLDTFAIVK